MISLKFEIKIISCVKPPRIAYHLAFNLSSSIPSQYDLKPLSHKMVHSTLILPPFSRYFFSLSPCSRLNRRNETHNPTLAGLYIAWITHRVVVNSDSWVAAVVVALLHCYWITRVAAHCFQGELPNRQSTYVYMRIVCW